MTGTPHLTSLWQPNRWKLKSGPRNKTHIPLSMMIHSLQYLITKRWCMYEASLQQLPQWLNGMAAQSSFNSDWELLGGTHQGTSWVGPKSRAFTNFEAICVYIYIYIYIQVGKSLERAKGGGTNPFESAIIIVLLCFHPLLLPSHTPLPLFSPHLFHGEKDIAVTVVTNSSPSFIQLSLLLGQRVFFSLHCE